MQVLKGVPSSLKHMEFEVFGGEILDHLDHLRPACSGPLEVWTQWTVPDRVVTVTGGVISNNNFITYNTLHNPPQAS